ncbi:MAG: hypothetical protein ABI308_12495, partial [Mucilaginibacter sp.]
HFALFKFDAVCSYLRESKQDAFINMMQQCRNYSPDLILLTHRIDLGKGAPYATTTLFNGEETYIDVHMANTQTASHHRAGAISRTGVPGLNRMVEDCGVCISSCLDFWDDDLVLQAFNRSLTLSPEIYGNPWLLRDDEYAKLARLFNLHKKYGDILANGKVLPTDEYGENAVSRGNGATRFITLRNVSWSPKSYTIKLDSTIGLINSNNPVEVRQIHPSEKIIGIFKKDDKVNIEVLPFRSSLLIVSSAPITEPGVTGVDYEVVKNVPGKPIEINLLAMPGQKRTIKIAGNFKQYKTALLNGKLVNTLFSEKSVSVQFPGTPLLKDWHRKITDLKPIPVPADVEGLYEATCFAADNNALEVRSLLRSGPTKIPEVQAARDAFFKHPIFTERGVWDKNAFDGNLQTAFATNRRYGNLRINGGALRLDLGKLTKIDKLVIKMGDTYGMQPLNKDESVKTSISADLKNWKYVSLLADSTMTLSLDKEDSIRYIRFNSVPDKILEIEGYYKGKMLDRSNWRASNLFAPYFPVGTVPFYPKGTIDKAWGNSFVLNEVPEGSYLCVALNGEHGVEGAYAALRVDGKLIGAPDRSISYPSNTWEYSVKGTDRNYTYYFPLTPDMKGKKIDAVVVGMLGGKSNFKAEVWITAYPVPYKKQKLILE